VNQQDQQAIDELFRYLYQTAQQAGPRDKDAEALIQRYVKQAPPGLLYQMAQAMVAQQHTVNQLRAQLEGYQRQNGAPAGFGAPPGPAGYGQGAGYGSYGQQYQQPGYQQPGYQQSGWRQGRQGGGFLAGAGQLALGIGGGILGAEVLTDIFDGVGNLFDGGRDRQFEDGYQDGFVAGEDRDQGGYPDQDPGAFNDQGQFDQGQFDQGQFDDGGFDDGGGGIF
jgi:uncharacterized protein